MGRSSPYPRIALPLALDCDEVQWGLLTHRFSDADIEYLSFHSPRDEGEFKRVMRWVRILGLSASQRISLNVGRGFQQSLDLSRNWWGAPEFREYLESYFWVRGYQWRRTEWGRRLLKRLRRREPHLRLFIEPQIAHWSISFERDWEPSFHEQMEARFELRDWLHTRIPDIDCESWLAPRNQT